MEYLQSEQWQKNQSFLSPTVDDMQNDYELVYNFIDSLVNYWFLQYDEVKWFYFPHKSFQEYFGYKYLDIQEDNWESILVSSLWIETEKRLNLLLNGDEKELKELESAYINQCKQLLLSYSFGDDYKLFEILWKIKENRKNANGKNRDYFDSWLFVEVVSQILEEKFGQKDLTYADMKNIKSTFKPDVVEDFIRFLSDHCYICGNFDEISIVKDICHKLNNLDQFWHESFKSDLNKLNIWSSGLGGEYPDVIFTDLMVRGAWYTLFNIFFDYKVA